MGPCKNRKNVQEESWKGLWNVKSKVCKFNVIYICLRVWGTKLLIVDVGHVSRWLDVWTSVISCYDKL